MFSNASSSRRCVSRNILNATSAKNDKHKRARSDTHANVATPMEKPPHQRFGALNALNVDDTATCTRTYAFVSGYRYVSNTLGNVNAHTHNVVTTAHADMTWPSEDVTYNIVNARNTAVLSCPASKPRCFAANALKDIAQRCAISPTARSFNSNPYESLGNMTANTYLYATYDIAAYDVMLTPLTVERGTT